MKARHLTKAQGPKVLLHAQNPAHYAHYAHLKLKYTHKRCDVPTHYAGDNVSKTEMQRLHNTRSIAHCTFNPSLGPQCTQRYRMHTTIEYTAPHTHVDAVYCILSLQ